ncbi:hypothetical protein [Actinomadura sp. 6N118]|uniref:hypothetical protein n=1 Tax=Actinomadura sp. 6N118 TaxID=3375151 RepID=UPI0037A1F354
MTRLLRGAEGLPGQAQQRRQLDAAAAARRIPGSAIADYIVLLEREAGGSRQMTKTATIAVSGHAVSVLGFA